MKQCMIRQLSILVSVTLIVILNPWGTLHAQQTSDSISISSLVDCSALLDKEVDRFSDSLNLDNADLYHKARAQIALYTPILSSKPDEETARQIFSACSLLTRAAVTQLQVEYNTFCLMLLQAEVNMLLDELNEIHEKIHSLERSNALKLKAELDAEKLKAQRLRNEAEKKFAELQSSLIKVSNNARGTIISMSDILFETGKAELTPDLKTNLAKIAGILLVFKQSNVIIEGHTDNQGSEEYNLQLSEQRAENVLRFLIDQGVAQSRLTSIGYGFSKPVADNSTKEGRQRNRRVDLVVQEIKTYP